MKFFQIAKVSNELGISSRNKVPEITDPKDIVSKSATIMSRLLSSNHYSPVMEFAHNAVYTANATYSKKRTPAGFSYSSQDAIARNLEYALGVGISSNVIARIPENGFQAVRPSSIKNLLLASAHADENVRNTWGATNNLGYYSDYFFRPIETSNCHILAANES